MRILDGCSLGDDIGKMNFYNSLGSSVIDYVICNVTFEMIKNFCVGEFNNNSNQAPIHQPVSLNVATITCKCYTGDTNYSYAKYVSWNNDYTIEHVDDNQNSVIASLGNLVDSKENIDDCTCIC